MDVLIARNPAQRALNSFCLSVDSAQDPGEDSHVFAKTRPKVLAVVIFSKPIYTENQGRIRNFTPHFQPMLEIIAHVVTTKGKHCKRITPYHSNSASGSSSGLGS